MFLVFFPKMFTRVALPFEASSLAPNVQVYLRPLLKYTFQSPMRSLSSKFATIEVFCAILNDCTSVPFTLSATFAARSAPLFAATLNTRVSSRIAFVSV